MQHKNLFISVLVPLAISFLLLGSTPQKAILGQYLVISEGATLQNVIEDLSEKGYIYSPFFMRSIFPVVSWGEEVKAGTYFMEPNKTLWGIIKQITTADYGVESIKVTLPEGVNVFQAALIDSTP